MQKIEALQGVSPGDRALLPVTPALGERTALEARDFNLTSIDLYLQFGCNRRCDFCFLDDTQLGSKEIMSLEMVEQVIAWAEGVDEITLLGGEPSLYPDFSKVVKMIDAAGKRVRVVTNGAQKFRATLKDPEMVAIYKKGRIAVSLEGEPGFNDKVRGKGAYKAAYATLEALTGLEIPTDINCTVMSSTIKDDDDRNITWLWNIAKRLGVRRLNLHSYSVAGRGREHLPGERLTKAQAKTVTELVSWLQTDAMLAHQEHFQYQKDFEEEEYKSPPIIDFETTYIFGAPGEDPDMCAVRDRSNLQFCPNGKVVACGKIIEFADELAGYEFINGRLFEASGPNEITKTAKPCGSCPLNIGSLCIYNRVERVTLGQFSKLGTWSTTRES